MSFLIFCPNKNKSHKSEHELSSWMPVSLKMYIQFPALVHGWKCDLMAITVQNRIWGFSFVGRCTCAWLENYHLKREDSLGKTASSCERDTVNFAVLPVTLGEMGPHVLRQGSGDRPHSLHCLRRWKGSVNLVIPGPQEMLMDTCCVPQKLLRVKTRVPKIDVLPQVPS